MALVDATLSTALQGVDASALAAAKAGTPWTSKQYWDAFSAVIDTQIKTAAVAGTATGAASGGPGVPVVGTLS